MKKLLECENNGLIMRGIAHIPDNKENKKLPAVICLHGFRGTNVGFAFSFVELSNKLEEQGVASFRFDFTGVGISDGEFINMSVNTEIDDAKRIIEYVSSLDYIDSERICLLGMSLGGAVAIKTAAMMNDKIKVLCLWSPAICLSDDLKKGHIQDAVIDEDARIRGYVDVKGNKVGMRYIDDGLKYNAYDTAADFKKDVLLMHGDADNIAPCVYSEKLAQCYDKEKITFIKVKGVGHVYENLEQREELINTTVKFIADKL